MGYFICYGTANMNSSLAWRTPFILLACLSIAFAVSSILWLVPSPRWLTLRGRQSEASAAWDLLGVGHAEREKAEEIELAASTSEAHNLVDSTDSSHRQGAASHVRNAASKDKHSFFDVFAQDVRSRTALAVFLLGMQQLSGIDGVLYVSPRSISVKSHPHKIPLTLLQSTHLFSSRKPASPPQKLPFSPPASRQLSSSA